MRLFAEAPPKDCAISNGTITLAQKHGLSNGEFPQVSIWPEEPTKNDPGITRIHLLNFELHLNVAIVAINEQLRAISRGERGPSPTTFGWNDVYVSNEVAFPVWFYFVCGSIEFVRRSQASESNPPATFTRCFVSVVCTTAVLREVREIRTIKEHGHTTSGVFIDWIRRAKASRQR